MLSSHPATIPEVIYALQALSPSSILDVGVGFGKYGVLIREYLEITQNRLKKAEWKLLLHGVEVFSGYKNPIYEYCYDHMFFKDICDLVDSLPMDYDVILMIDVIEHLPKKEGKSLLERLVRKTKKSLIPFYSVHPLSSIIPSWQST